MRSLTVRLPDQLVMEIEAESRKRGCAKSDVVRERLQRGAGPAGDSSARLNVIADLIGSVEGPGTRATQCFLRPAICSALEGPRD